ncbi:MAG: tRNA dihydrouridine synthase DusB [Gammaproteobacteria bacterium]
MQIGPYRIEQPVVLAPMAGVTDLPFRALCRRLGAGLVVAEMLTANHALWHTPKSRLRRVHEDEPAPRSVQIAGAEPAMLADAARLCVEGGAQIVDINMGCPAKKVCSRAAGSALLRDESLVREILAAVVCSVDVPVTLKIRTGWAPDERNGVRIARLAEDSGIAALAVHGRTRADRFNGHAEYDTIAAIKQAVRIPVIANGDISTPQQARAVLAHTGADAVMIGRAAQGNPWIFREISHFLATGHELPPPDAAELRTTVHGHLDALHAHYGEHMGVRIARKHVGWYLDARAGWDRNAFNNAACAAQQHDLVDDFFLRAAGSHVAGARLSPENLAA